LLQLQVSAKEIDISKCPSIGWNFKISPYLKVSKQLQALGKPKAIQQLEQWAKSQKYEDQVVILCRILFVARKGKVFRRPGLGGANFHGGTNYKDWTNEPVALHGGIPILITYGYSLYGQAEPSSTYLEYCQKSCDWNKTKYKILTQKEIRIKIGDFVSSTKWKVALSPREMNFFTNQSK